MNNTISRHSARVYHLVTNNPDIQNFQNKPFKTGIFFLFFSNRSRIFYSILEFQRKAIRLRNSPSTQNRIKYWQGLGPSQLSKQRREAFSLWAETSFYKIKLFFPANSLYRAQWEYTFQTALSPNLNTAQHEVLISSHNVAWTRMSASDRSGGVASEYMQHQGVDNQL